MTKAISFLKFVGKWGAIALAVYVFSTWLTGLDFETRYGWYMFLGVMALGYVDGTGKDRAAELEQRIKYLERQAAARQPANWDYP